MKWNKKHSKLFKQKDVYKRQIQEGSESLNMQTSATFLHIKCIIMVDQNIIGVETQNVECLVS